MNPQDYATRTDYRPPASWYQQLNRLGVLLTSLGLAPRDAVTLQVRGRKSGKVRRIPILRTRYQGGTISLRWPVSRSGSGMSEQPRAMRSSAAAMRGMCVSRSFPRPTEPRSSPIICVPPQPQRRQGQCEAGPLLLRPELSSVHRRNSDHRRVLPGVPRRLHRVGKESEVGMVATVPSTAGGRTAEAPSGHTRVKGPNDEGMHRCLPGRLTATPSLALPWCGASGWLAFEVSRWGAESCARLL
jgi:hypothetical protein